MHLTKGSGEGLRDPPAVSRFPSQASIPRHSFPVSLPAELQHNSSRNGFCIKCFVHKIPNPLSANGWVLDLVLYIPVSIQGANPGTLV